MCMVGSETSSTVHPHDGVGEGSIVGPLIFIAILCDITIVAKWAMERLLN